MLLLFNFKQLKKCGVFVAFVARDDQSDKLQTARIMCRGRTSRSSPKARPRILRFATPSPQDKDMTGIVIAETEVKGHGGIPEDKSKKKKKTRRRYTRKKNNPKIDRNQKAQTTLHVYTAVASSALLCDSDLARSRRIIEIRGHRGRKVFRVDEGEMYDDDK